jgi:hypothetical protein
VNYTRIVSNIILVNALTMMSQNCEKYKTAKIENRGYAMSSLRQAFIRHSLSSHQLQTHSTANKLKRNRSEPTNTTQACGKPTLCSFLNLDRLSQASPGAKDSLLIIAGNYSIRPFCIDDTDGTHFGLLVSTPASRSQAVYDCKCHQWLRCHRLESF